MNLVYLIQAAGLVGLGFALRGKPSDMAALGRLTALLGAVTSVVFWDAW